MPQQVAPLAASALAQVGSSSILPIHHEAAARIAMRAAGDLRRHATSATPAPGTAAGTPRRARRRPAFGALAGNDRVAGDLECHIAADRRRRTGRSRRRSRNARRSPSPASAPRAARQQLQDHLREFRDAVGQDVVPGPQPGIGQNRHRADPAATAAAPPGGSPPPAFRRSSRRAVAPASRWRPPPRRSLASRRPLRPRSEPESAAEPRSDRSSPRGTSWLTQPPD